MEPSFTSVTGDAGFVRVLVSFRTSAIRSADSADMVTMTKIMLSIMRDMRIWKL